MTIKLQLLSDNELSLKLSRLRALMAQCGAKLLVVNDNSNKFWLTGRVFAGYIAVTDSTIQYFVRRGADFEGDGVTHIRKPEDMGALLNAPFDATALELDQTPYAVIERLIKALGINKPLNADALLSQSRAVKTPAEVALIEEDARCHERVYAKVPSLYRPGMTDVELQIAIENVTRLEGSLGLFRVMGADMEINMGSVLAGPNAAAPSPYDFALGGAGVSPALPLGADGTIIEEGMAVMVDVNGCFNGYMTDMTRTFALGELPQEALDAHACSIAICRALEELGTPGTPCNVLYDKALSMAEEAGLKSHFMGTRQQAGFVGHGVGIAVNELPVIAPRYKAPLQAGNIIALEPKFVLPGVGALGIENTYEVTDRGLRQITRAPEQIIRFS